MKFFSYNPLIRRTAGKKPIKKSIDRAVVFII